MARPLCLAVLVLLTHVSTRAQTPDQQPQTPDQQPQTPDQQQSSATPTVHDLLEDASSAPAQEAFQRLQSISILLDAWPTLSVRAKVRALRIAKLHRDGATRVQLVHLACADAPLKVRKACIDVAGRSTEESMVQALVAAASRNDAEGDRAARLVAHRAGDKELRQLCELVAQAPKRTALTSAAAKTYWRMVAAGVDGSALRTQAAPAMRAPEARRRFLLALAQHRDTQARDPAGLMLSAIEAAGPNPSFDESYHLLVAARHLAHGARKVDVWVEQFLGHELWMLRRAALAASVMRLPTQAPALLMTALSDTSPRVRLASLVSLRSLPSIAEHERTNAFRHALEGEAWPSVRAEAVVGLASIGDYEAVARLLGDPARRVRAQAIRSLASAPQTLRLAAARHVLRKDPEWPDVQVAALEMIEAGCLSLGPEIAAFIRREDARADRLSSEEALFKAIVVYSLLVFPPSFADLADELRFAPARAAAKPLLQSGSQPTCLDRRAQTTAPAP